MSEKCKNAYRKRGHAAVYCKAIEGDMNVCGHQFSCPRSQRWEVNCSAQCSYRHKPSVRSDV